MPWQPLIVRTLQRRLLSGCLPFRTVSSGEISHTMPCRDGGIIIDEQMQTSAPGIFAAGDVCCAKALEQASAHWFQMRLWTQVMGQLNISLCCCKASETVT
jgi:Pyridine nucleotide-disulphide oxidoreductase